MNIKMILVYSMLGYLASQNILMSTIEPVKSEGIYIHAIRDAKKIWPTANKKFAFFTSKINEDGLYIINFMGTVLNKNNPLLKGSTVENLFPTRYGTGAWVLVKKKEMVKRKNKSRFFIRERKDLYFIKDCEKNTKPLRVDIPKKIYPSEVELFPMGNSNHRSFIFIGKAGSVEHIGILNEERLKILKNAPLPHYSLKGYWNMNDERLKNTDKKIWYIKSNIKNSFQYVLVSIDSDGDINAHPIGSNLQCVYFAPTENDVIWVCRRSMIEEEGLHLHKIEENNFVPIANMKLDHIGLPIIKIFPINRSKAWIQIDSLGSIKMNTQELQGTLFFVDTENDKKIIDTKIESESRWLLLDRFGKFLWNWDIKKKSINQISQKKGTIIIKKFATYEKYPHEFTPVFFRPITLAEDNQSIFFKSIDGLRHFLNTNEKLSGPILQDYLIQLISYNCQTQTGLISASNKLSFKKNSPNFFSFCYPHQKGQIIANLQFGKNKISSLKAGCKITESSNLRSVAIKLILKNQDRQDEIIADGNVSLIISKINKRGIVLSAKKDGDISNELTFNKNPFNRSGKYNIKLIYTNDFGSNLSYTWDSIDVVIPWFNTQLFRTLIFALSIIVLSLVSLWNPSIPYSYRGWLFILILSFPGIGSAFYLNNIFDRHNIDIVQLNIFLGVFFILFTLFGVINPTLFIKLARTQPYSFFAHISLLVPVIRKRFYTDYLKELKYGLIKKKERAYTEHYFPIPVKIKPSQSSESIQKNFPASFLYNCIHNYFYNHTSKSRKKKSKDKSNVPSFLIEGAAGLGKSALAREVIQIFINKFKDYPYNPVPIYITDVNWETKNTEDSTGFLQLLKDNLGDFFISTEFLSRQLERGEFLIIIENIHEEKIPPEEIRKMLNKRKSNPSPVIGIGRYNMKIHDIFDENQSTILVSPMPLTENNIENYIKNYVPSLETGYKIPQEIKAACANPDQTYNPLLVRLALLNIDKKPTTIREIYQNAFRSFLKAGSYSSEENCQLDQKIQQTIELCRVTYWKTGERTFSFTQEQRPLIMTLMNSGLLISADILTSRSNLDPRWVRFFHDTMQSYLTARALNELHITMDDKKERQNLLLEIAGAPRFAEDQTSSDDKIGNELLMMCLEIFGPPNKLSKDLTDSLQNWGKNEIICEKLTKAEIFNALPQIFVKNIREKSLGLDISKTLQYSIDICEDNLRNLSRLFGRLAPWVYKIITGQ